MAHILICNVEAVSEKQLNAFLEQLSTEKREKLKRFRNRKDVVCSAVGECMVRYAMKTFYGVSEIQIGYGEYGKPYLKNLPVYFNISHSGNQVVVITDCQPVGVDIEYMDKNIDINEIIPFFHKYERERIEQAKDTFVSVFQIWTMKESYIKMLGDGLSKNMDGFYIDHMEKKAIVHDLDRMEDNEYYGENIIREDAYVLSYISHTECDIQEIAVDLNI